MENSSRGPSSPEPGIGIEAGLAPQTPGASMSREWYFVDPDAVGAVPCSERFFISEWVITC